MIVLTTDAVNHFATIKVTPLDLYLIGRALDAAHAEKLRQMAADLPVITRNRHEPYITAYSRLKAELPDIGQ